MTMSLDRSDQYDPYIPGSNPNQPGGGPGPAASTGGASGSKTQDIQREIDATVGIMRDNITKVAERGERLDALQDKTDNLAQSAQGFRRGANRVRKKMVRPQATAFVVPELTPLSPRSGGKLCKTVRPSYPYLTKVLHGRPCRKDMKMRVLIAVAIAVLVIVIVVPIVVKK
ncbi:hypothetical protein BMF94_0964 [Rhodotorula taiwanensis]|uniref:V-SNARE coiled-coil homology domain-containing protein n=1 Tax=Rhodotorula taiwanensis TaxID=741276 RepID=A0A2S5BGI7_9BASI|nr:hypothetical protein BMF94_0964 [Rhodotorula taiwanensis]